MTVSVVEPKRLPKVAVMTDVPPPTPDASPPATIVATPGVPELQVTLLVTSWVPRMLVFVAVNCCEAPSGIDGLAGVTEIDSRGRVTPMEIFDTKASWPNPPPAKAD